MNTPIRVLIVDDSAFICYVVGKHLEDDPSIKVVGSAHNGLEALSQITSLKPDVVILDVEMPQMDGLTTLKRIMAECPTPVIMFSVLTKRGARTTVQALLAGAIDFVSKPEAKSDIYGVIKNLITQIKTAAGTRLPKLPSAETKPLTAATKLGPERFQKGDSLVVIGASTGGPRALQEVLCGLPANIPAAIVVVQHMPPGFTRSLAQRLHETCPLRVQEAAAGDRLARGLVLLAPGDFHLSFSESGQVQLDQGPRRHYVRPAVDVTMESAVQYYKSAVIGVILTGMGSDGTEGAKCIKAAGGKVIAEHESTSVVYGMPRSVAEAGWVDQVVPRPKIAAKLLEWVNNGSVRV